MKNIALLISIPLLLASAFHVPAQTLSGPATINLTAAVQVMFYSPISITTNRTATATNITEISKNSLSNGVVNLLDLLANSFKTNFPAGARLFLVQHPPTQGSTVFGTNFSFYVTDKAGTNIILSPSPSVIGLNRDTNCNSPGFQLTGLQTYITSRTKLGTTILGGDTETLTMFVYLTYDDSSLTPEDGKHSVFHCYGVLTDKFSVKNATNKATALVSVSCAGYGTIQNKPVYLEKGTLTATLAGIL